MQQLGRDSNVRNRLTTLDSQLKQQMNRIIEYRSDGLTFHHQAVSQVEQDGRHIVEQSMGGVGGLQQALQTEWNNQEQDFQQFGRDVCQRVTALEQQRRDLVKALP